MTYPLCLRLAAIKYYVKHNSDPYFYVKSINEIFDIAVSTFYIWLDKYGADVSSFNDLLLQGERKQCNKKESKITATIRKYIVHLFTKLRSSSALNVKRNVLRNFNVHISIPYIYKILREENVTYKKISTTKWPFTEAKLKKEKQKLKKEIDERKEKDIISFDETSIVINMQTSKGWSKSGQRCERYFKRSQVRYSLGLAINKKDVVKSKLIQRSFKGDEVTFFMNDLSSLLNDPHLYTILMDNARTHTCKKMKLLINDKNIDVLFNIKYHPQSNPVEYVFGILKQKLRKSIIRTESDLINKINKILNSIPKTVFAACYNKSYNLL